MNWSTLIAELLKGITHLAPGNVVMMAIWRCVLIYLAIAKEYEPVLLLPIGFGCYPRQHPADRHDRGHGVFGTAVRRRHRHRALPAADLHRRGRDDRFRPAAGAAEDGAAGRGRRSSASSARCMLATLLGFDIKEAASIGIIGAADGPTSIYVASKLAPDLLAPIAVAAYSYMSLVPIIQPPVMRLLTTKAERRIRMPYTARPVSQHARVLFPIVVTLVAGLIVPGRAADRHADVRQPAARGRRGGPPEQDGAERAGQHRHDLPGADDRLDDGGRQLSDWQTHA